MVSSEGERRDRFEALVADVYDPLQRYIRRRVTADEAGDVLSDVLLTMWRRLEDVPEGAVLPWSYGVARRTVSNHRRAASRHLRLVERLEAERSPVADDDPAILRLWAWEQLEPREIALTLGSTANAVSLRLSRARKKLADAMARQYPSTPGHIGDETAEENRR